MLGSAGRAVETGMGKPTNIAWHVELPVVRIGAVVCRSARLRLERARRQFLLHQVIQRCRRAAQPLQCQEAIGQEAHGGVVVKAGPGASLEMVQPQLLVELLVALLHLPARLPQANRLQHGRLRRQVRQRIADGAITPPLHQQPARFGLQIRYILRSATVLPAVGWPHALPGKLGVQRAFGALPPAQRCAFESFGQVFDGQRSGRIVATCRRSGGRPRCVSERTVHCGGSLKTASLPVTPTT